MTKTDTRDARTTLKEIERLAFAGCDIIRLAVPDEEAADALKVICRESPIPVIADIHFDHELAIKSCLHGVHGLRINPGNLRSKEKVRKVIAAAKGRSIPIRIGVNAGSLDPAIIQEFGAVTPEALATSALREIELLENEGFEAMKIAIKAFAPHLMTTAVRIIADRCPYPLHLGVTEAGLPEEGIIRSAIGIGSLLLQGLGDTIRVSLTGDSADEIAAGIRILKSLGLKEAGPIIVSCPTCGRCQIPLQKMAKEVKERVQHLKVPLRIAVMGCAVNGPGEAQQADIGIAGGKDGGLLFRKGEIVKALPTSELVDALIQEISLMFPKLSFPGKDSE